MHSADFLTLLSIAFLFSAPVFSAVEKARPVEAKTTLIKLPPASAAAAAASRPLTGHKLR